MVPTHRMQDDVLQRRRRSKTSNSPNGSGSAEGCGGLRMGWCFRSDVVTPRDVNFGLINPMKNTDWWFRTCFIFPNSWDDDPI